MSFRPIIISGPSCAGKTTIAKELEKTNKYITVKAVTTRTKRSDDFNYKYVSKNEFDGYEARNELFVSTSYLNKKYGILKSEYENAKKSKKIPVLIVASDSASSLIYENSFDAIWFFIDSTDEIIKERLKKRGGYTKDKIKELSKQNTTDRRYASKSNYIINSNDQNIKSIVELIDLLVQSYHIGGGLSNRIIKLMLDCGMLLDNTTDSSIKGASYDLLLGDEYYYDGKIRQLNDKNPFLTIEPYDYAIVSCKESARIPRDVIGKFGLTVKLFCQGIILSNGPQIDPGFNGTLFCLLFNTSNQAVHLKRGMHYATIEFNKLFEPAPPYEGNYQGKTKIIDYIPANALHGAINELKKEIEQLKKESKSMQNIYLAVVGLMFAILSILLVLR